jgi:hypothetical protein
MRTIANEPESIRVGPPANFESLTIFPLFSYSEPLPGKPNPTMCCSTKPSSTARLT